MGRVFTVLVTTGVILGAIAGLEAVAYGVGGLVEGIHPGLANLTNIVFLILVFVMVIATLLTLAERKWSAMMQDRIGPNRAAIDLPGMRDKTLGGLFHIPADVLKMLFKEDFIPGRANPILFNLAPILAFSPVFALFAVVPVGPTVAISGNHVPMVVADPDYGVLFLFAIASLAVYGTALAGWSSNNKFALLGGVRASSQMISYEVALGLSLVGMMLTFATVRLTSMADAQSAYLWRAGGDWDFGLPAWGIFLQPIGFLLFFAAAFAETKRAPFDVPEGESEIIGYFVEYSGMKFGLFMIAEFVEVVVLSGVIAAVFLGGYHLPVFEQALSRLDIFHDHPWIWGTLLSTVFWIKVIFLCWVQLLIRWTFPRFRYDQIQTLGWKILLPAGLVNLFITGALVLWGAEGAVDTAGLVPSLRPLAAFGLLTLGVIVALTFAWGGEAKTSPAHGHGALAPGHPH